MHRLDVPPGHALLTSAHRLVNYTRARTTRASSVATRLRDQKSLALPSPISYAYWRSPSHASSAVRNLCVCALLLVCWSSLAFAQSQPQRTQTKAKLAEVRARIQGLHQRLTQDRLQHDTLSAALRDSEKQAATLNTELRAAQSGLEQQTATLNGVKTRETQAQQAVQMRRQRLAKQARANYRLSLHSRVALALKQEHPAALARALAYAAHVDQAQARHISALSEELQRLNALEEKVNTERATLLALREQKALALAKLEALRTTRAALLEQLEADIAARDANISQLSADANKLEELLAGLRETLPDDFSMAAERRPFVALKGKLPWPLNGTIKHAYGQSRGGNKGLKWRGVIIGGKAGQEVRAIYHGRVAFANWLRGFGLLTIIDHGDGYLSLYGHNESLSADVGDWVSPGDVIAHVGDTGGARETGLYFEIRHRGTPSDPRQWCSRDVAPANAVLVKP